jgi:NAD(P)-dependent dehydrogenase (short-subunit alcohol dehydrogenase family)
MGWGCGVSGGNSRYASLAGNEGWRRCGPARHNGERLRRAGTRPDYCTARAPRSGWPIGTADRFREHGTAEYNETNYRVSFFYDLAKAANIRMAFALAHELQPHHATAVSLTPGWLRSEAMLDAYGVTESNWRDATKKSPHFAITESPAFVGRAVAALAGDPDVGRWNGKGLSSGQLAKIYGFTDLDGSQPDAWRYVTEVQDAGKPADVSGYR